MEIDLDETGGMSHVEGLKLALQDIKLYILGFINMGINAAMGWQNLFPTLTATFGFSEVVSLLLAAPPFVFIAFYRCLHSHLSDRTEKRFWYILYPVPVSVAGYVLFMTTDTFGVRYFGTFLMTFINPMADTVGAWAASSISRPTAKRAAAYGFINAAANSASIWTPFIYRNQDSPYFCLALGICARFLCLSGFLSICLRVLLVRENRKLDKMDAEGGNLTEAEMARLAKTAEAEGIDIATTRRLQQGFRYTL